MKKFTRLLILMMALAVSGIVSAQSVTATYTAGDLPTSYSSYDPSCSGMYSLTVTIPAGSWFITGVDVSYDMTAASGAWMSEQNSKLEYVEGATAEAGFTSGTGYGGTMSYSRTALDIANGPSAGGDLNFVLQAYRAWGGSLCETNYNKVDDGTWTVTVYYGPPLGNVEGFVHSTSGTVLVDALVSYDMMETRSDATGYYLLMDLPTGAIDISCSAAGYSEAINTVNVMSGATVTHDFILGQPSIAVTPLIFDETLHPEEYLTTYLSLLNTGDGPADFSAVVVYPPAVAPSNVTYEIDPAYLGAQEVQDDRAILTEGETAPWPKELFDYSGRSTRADLDIAIVTSANSGSNNFSTLETALLGLGINSVTVIYLQPLTTTAADLLAYDGVLFGLNTFFTVSSDPVGDMLADYIDMGGKLIMTSPINATGYSNLPIGGRLATDGYYPVTTGSLNGGTVGAGTFDADHPIMEGVTTYGGSLTITCNEAAGAELVASYSGGTAFVATKTVTNPVVQVNSFVAATGYVSGDVPLVIFNAFNWLQSSGGVGGWLTLDDYEGTVPPGGGSFNIGTNLDASGTVAGEVYTADIVLTTNPNVGTITIPVTMTIGGDPFPTVGGFEAVLTNPVTGEVTLTWDAARITLDYYKIYRNGTIVTTVDASTLTYVDMLPAFGSYDYEIQPIFVEGDGAKVGPETVEWFEPTLCWDPANPQNTQWPNVEEAVMLELENCGNGTLEFSFPDYAVRALLNDPSFVPNETSYRAPIGEQVKGKDDQYNGMGNDVIRGAGGPDAFGYVWIDSDEPGGPVYNWMDISATGTLVSGLSDDNVVGPFPMSFTFPYYGEDKTELWINSNGTIGFTSSYITFGNVSIPTGNTSTDFIAWFWDDMNPNSGGSVYYEDFGNYFVVQFDDYPEYGGAAGDVIDAQVIINKNGSVIVNYDYVAPGLDILGNTVGIQSSNNSVGLGVSFNTGYVHDGLALYMGPPGDHFIVDVEPFHGTINEGETADIVMTYSSEGFEEEGEYYEDLAITTNEMPANEWDIPNTMIIELPAMFDGLVTDCNDANVRLSNVTITAVMQSNPDISFTTETAENGTYMLYVNRAADYIVTASRAGYVTQTVTTYIDLALTLDFAMCEEPYPVSMVVADPNEADTECLVTWTLPMGPYLIVYDDGTAEEYFAWVSPGGMSAVKFTPANYPATVKGADIFVGDGSYPEGGNFIGTPIEIMVFDDDGTDGMPGTAIDSIVVTVDDYGWVNVSGLNATFADGDFYVVYRQMGFAPHVAPVGIDQDVPTVYRSYVKATNGEWMASLYQDMMIRAIVSGTGDNVLAMSMGQQETTVYPGKLSPKKYITTGTPDINPGVQGEGKFSPVIADASTRDFDNYIVARVSDFDPYLPLGPANGTLVPIGTPSANLYNDTNFDDQPDGFYAYAVKAVYESNESDWVYSNIVAHGLDNVATFTVSQCDGLSPIGAVLTLSGRDYPNHVLVEVVDATGIVVLDSVINGVYDLTVAKDGYTTYVHDELFIFADYSETVVLVELMFPARKLMVESMTSVANWRSPYTLFMDNEGFDEGTDFPPAGWQTTSFGFGWEHTDDGSSGAWPIPPGDGWYAVANDDGPGSNNDGCCDYLIMPAIDLSATDGLLVQFDAYMSGAYSQTATVEYSMDGGSTWTVAMDIPAKPAWATYQTDLDDAAGSEAVLVAFHANDNGAWASGLAIDNVSAFWGTDPIGYEVSLDGGFVAETAADVTTYTYLNLQYGVTYEASVRAIYSCGTSEPVFYTFTSNYLYPPRNLMDEYVYGTNEVPLFWNPPMTVAGPGPMISLPNVVIDNNAVTSVSVASRGAAPVSSTTGDNMSNYTFNPDFGENIAWISSVASDNLWTMDMVTYATSTVGASAVDPASGDFMNDDETTMYVATTWGADLSSVDVTTGAATYIAAFTGQTGGYGVNGMACDKATNTMYVAMTDGGLTASQIGTLDLATGIITPIGSPNSVAPGLIDIAIDGAGQMYGWGLVNNSSYMIDKADGSVVVLGDIGYDANFGQGGNWNADDGMIYLTAYNASSGSAELRVLDPVTGGTAFLAALPDAQMTAFGVPRQGGGGGGGNIPSGLLSFNVYRDGGFIAEVPYEGQTTEEWVTYVDNNLMPDCYSYEVTAVYDLTDFGFPGEMGESSMEGPDEVCVVWGKDLPFCEDWSIGTFEHNDWMTSGDNWVIGADVGNGAPSAQWNWDPDPGADYASTLTSSPFNADMLTEGSVMLDFDLELADRNKTGDEKMVVEVYDGSSWYAVASFDNVDGSFDFTNYQVDLTTYAKGGVFQIRFSAQGVNSFDVISWNIDNICVYRECTAPYNLTGEYVWNTTDDLGAEICWEAAIAPASAGWFYYDDETIEYVWGNSTEDWASDVAIKVEAADLVDYEGAAVTMIRGFVDGSIFGGVGTVSVKVMQGENPDPSAPMYVEDVTAQVISENDWNEFTFTDAVLIDYTQPLWLGLYITGPAGTSGAGITTDMGVSNPNGELYYEAGSWVTLAGAGIDNRAWLLRGYVTTTFAPSSVELGSSVVLPTSDLATAGSINPISADVSLTEVNASRDLTVFNIYRMAAMDTDYELLTTVPYDPLVGAYCYYDDDVNIQEGYYYQVTAAYVSEMDACESAPAMALEMPMDDFVYIFVTGIDDPNAETTNLYPNPATDRVTVSSTTAIEQITVINYVGQVVLIQKLSGEKSITLNTDSYESGVYVVRIDTESGVVTKRVVITE